MSARWRCKRADFFLVERPTNPDHDAAANDVEHALRRVENAGDDGKSNEGRNAMTWENPVVDLEHEHRTRERDDIQDKAEQPDAE